MKFLIKLLVFSFIISLQAGEKPHRFQSNATRPSIQELAKLIKKDSSQISPVITKPVITPAKRVPVISEPKIYIDSDVPNLIIDWLDNDEKTTGTFKIPKDSNTPIKVPEDIIYFKIINETETSKSDKLRVANNTIYKVTCAESNCLKLQVVEAKKTTRSKSTKEEHVIIKKEIPKGAEVIYINNNTDETLQIAWLTKLEKLIETDTVDYVQGKQPYVKSKNAEKFKIIRGGGALESKVVNVIKNNQYNVKCNPSNYECNSIIIEHNILQDRKYKKDFEVIYFKNKTKEALEIAWLTKQGTFISNEIVSYVEDKKEYKKPKNAEKFKIIRGGGSLESKITNAVTNNEYQIECKPSNYSCNTIEITNTKDIKYIEKEADIDKENSKSNSAIYLVNKSKKDLQVNWLNSNEEFISSEYINSVLDQKKIHVVPNAIKFTISNRDKSETSSVTTITDDYVYGIDCTVSKNKCTQISVSSLDSIEVFKKTRKPETTIKAS